MTKKKRAGKRVASDDVLERAGMHLASMAPHIRDRLTAKLLEEVCKELKWERGRWPGKITQHWLRSAFDRVAAGEPEDEVMADYGYERSNNLREPHAGNEATEHGEKKP